MNNINSHDRFHVLEMKIRGVGKQLLQDRRTIERFNKDRRTDNDGAKIFNNTIRYNIKNDFPPEITENFIKDVRTGKFGRI